MKAKTIYSGESEVKIKKGWYVYYYNNDAQLVIIAEGLTYAEAVTTTLWTNHWHKHLSAHWENNNE